MRRCIACRESKPQDELMRFTFADGRIIADSNTKNDGRGIYLCPKSECLELALKRKAFNRVCRSNVDTKNIESAISQAIGDQGRK